MRSTHHIVTRIGEHPPFLCPRAQVNNGIARPNWARRETRLAIDQHRTPDPRWDPQLATFHHHTSTSRTTTSSNGDIRSCSAGRSRSDSTLVCSNSCNAWPTSKHFVSNFEYETTASSLPQCSRRPRWTEQRHFPVPGHYVSGNLWNLDIPTVSTNPGPMGSFMRHVTTMLSPTNPSYVTTRQWPVPSITQLRTDPTFENIAAHQAYLEKLQFKQNTLRSWSHMVQDQIMGEAAQIHHQLVQMVLTM